MLEQLDKDVADEWVSSLQHELGILQSSIMLKDVLIRKLGERVCLLEVDKAHLTKIVDEKTKAVEELRSLTKPRKK